MRLGYFVLLASMAGWACGDGSDDASTQTTGPDSTDGTGTPGPGSEGGSETGSAGVSSGGEDPSLCTWDASPTREDAEATFAALAGDYTVTCEDCVVNAGSADFTPDMTYGVRVNTLSFTFDTDDIPYETVTWNESADDIQCDAGRITISVGATIVVFEGDRIMSATWDKTGWQPDDYVCTFTQG